MWREKKVIIDGMAELQSLHKPAAITTCTHLTEHFTGHLLQKHCDGDEIRLVFNRYDVPRSLKSGTRVRRQGDQDPVYRRITDSTLIAKVPLKRLVSHRNSKMDFDTVSFSQGSPNGRTQRT